MPPVRIPSSTDELWIELGRAVLIDELHALGGEVPTEDRGKETSHFAYAAKIWRNHNWDDVRGVAIVAQRALSSLDPMESIMDDMASNVCNITVFLQRCRPDYLANVFHAGLELQGQEFLDFLTLLSELIT